MPYPFAVASALNLNITAATVLRTGAGYVQSISVITSGAVGGIFDATGTGATAGRQICTIPATVGVFQIGLPCVSGVVVVPGAGQALAVALA